MGSQKPRKNGLATKSAANCAVCSDPAPSRNFDAITCAACAAFFRNSIADGRVYKCRRVGKCELNKEFRNRCRCCRLAKCLRAGMREELVQKRVLGKVAEASTAKHKKDQQKLCRLEIINSKTLSSWYALWSSDTSSTLQTLLELEKQFLRSGADFSSAAGLKDGETEEENHSATLVNNPAEFVMKNGVLPCWLNPWQEDQKILCSLFANALLYNKQISVEDRYYLLQYVRWPAIYMQCYFYSATAKNDRPNLMTTAGIYPHQIYNSEKYGDDPNLRKMSKKLFEEPLTLWHRVRPTRYEFVLLLALIHTHVATPGVSDDGRKILLEESKRYSGCLVRLQQDQFGHWDGILRHMETMDMISACFEAAEQHAELENYMNVLQVTSEQTPSPAHDQQMGEDIPARSPSSAPLSFLAMIHSMEHSSHSIHNHHENIDLIEYLPDNMAPESSPQISGGIITMTTQTPTFTQSAIHSAPPFPPLYNYAPENYIL